MSQRRATACALAGLLAALLLPAATGAAPLRANDDFIGVVGLLEYTSPRLPEPAGEPQLTTYPAPDGKGTISVRVSAVWDPDGYFIELNQLLGTAAGTETR